MLDLIIIGDISISVISGHMTAECMPSFAEPVTDVAGVAL